MPSYHEQVRDSLPRLSPTNYQITSQASWNYNCIAWAAGVTDTWWWPTQGRYWPPNVPRQESLSAFIAAFKSLNYESCATADLEPGREKIALFAQGDVPTHAARQLPSGSWTSKLGPSVDIEHNTPEDVGGGTY